MVRLTHDCLPAVAPKSKKRSAEDDGKASVKKKGKSHPTAIRKSCRMFSQGQNLVSILTFHSEHPPPSLGSTEEDEISIRKQTAVRKKGNDAPNTQKATKVIRARDNTSDIEKGSDVSENSDSDGSDLDTNGNSCNKSSSSVDDLEPQSGSEVASISEKNNPPVCKPSKRVIETALNEVSLVATY